MWCAFEGRPRIVRVHGRGEAVLPADPRFAALADRFPGCAGVRSVVLAAADRASTSCGFGVPVMTFVADRDQLGVGHRKGGVEGIAAYQAERNAVSVDGLPGLS